ncbi:hypothetical protein [Salinibaculum salinum]|uniref:hypothetical protein n=1 Tax=Salinibaculum salinum TaxID=3131996 RepID=UPI0030EBA640
MVPRTTRRRYLSGLSLAGLATLAGCIDSQVGDDGTPTSTPDSQSTPGDDGDELGSPTEMVRESIEVRVEDPPAMREYFHPIHPFHPDNLSDEEADELLSQDSELDSVKTETRSLEVTPELVLTAPLLRLSDEIEREAVEDALDGEQTAVVDTTFTTTDGEETEFLVVTVTHDDEWVILAQDVQPASDEPTHFEARVVDDVTFDTEEDRARVHFVDSLVADSVAVETKTATSSRSSDTPDTLTYVDVYPDPEGDEIVVTATVDGQSGVVHREQYPPSERIVDEITYEEAPDDSPREMRARVTFTGNQGSREVTARSTVHGEEVALETSADDSWVFVGIDPKGDEIVVTTTVDGESQVVHRERYHPE